MIKLHGERNGVEFVGLGLSEGNLQRLREDKPILVDLRELGLPYPIQVLIFWGESEEQMVATLKDGGLLDGVKTIPFVEQ